MKAVRSRPAPLWHAPEVRLVVWGFGLSAWWEALQTPLYADAGGGLRYLLWTRLHCTGGDVLILLGSFWAVSLLRRSRRWFRRRDRLAAGLFAAIGLAYTAASEAYNTQVAHTWAYAPQMPRLLGIGIAPLLQWLVVPAVVLTLLRRGEPPARS